MAQWREGLGAQTSLRAWYFGDSTVGYQNHPQLERFKTCENPLGALHYYLLNTYSDSLVRKYKFNVSKLIVPDDTAYVHIPLHEGQLDYEIERLRGKIEKRAPEELWRLEEKRESAYIFQLVDGDVETWEKV